MDIPSSDRPKLYASVAFFKMSFKSSWNIFAIACCNNLFVIFTGNKECSWSLWRVGRPQPKGIIPAFWQPTQVRGQDIPGLLECGPDAKERTTTPSHSVYYDNINLFNVWI